MVELNSVDQRWTQCIMHGGKAERCCKTMSLYIVVMGGTFQATVEFLDSSIVQKLMKMALICILSVNSHCSGFRFKL